MSTEKSHRDAELERSLVEVFGDENGQIGLMASHKMTDEQLVQIGAIATDRMARLHDLSVVPSSDLFKTNVYSLYDKSPKQIAVDLQAIQDRIAHKQEAAFQKKVKKGEAVRIDLRGKSLEEVDLMGKQMSFEAAKRREKEQKFSDNIFISALDSVSDAVSVPVSYGKKALNFIKDNPGKSIAGAGAAVALWKMLDNDGEGIDVGKLLLIGLALVIGSAWMYDKQPESFNKLAGAFGLDSFFNQAPSKPMLKPGLGETIVGFFGMKPEKFGDVSAEAAGSSTSNDARLVSAANATVESWKQEAESTTVPTSVKSRSLS